MTSFESVIVICFVELLWSVDVVPFGIDWCVDEVAAGDDQVVGIVDV